MAVLDQNIGLTPFELHVFIKKKKLRFRLFEVLVFRSRISQKSFPWAILPKKKNSLKNGHFWTKPWVNPFGKMSILQLF